jgi:hypothetical protein
VPNEGDVPTLTKRANTITADTGAAGIAVIRTVTGDAFAANRVTAGQPVTSASLCTPIGGEPLGQACRLLGLSPLVSCPSGGVLAGDAH